ncbi:hypothetical protein GCM10027594_08090 [Hymenobacter agri]
MGLHLAEIRFDTGVPSFQSIREQYKRQTGLNIELVATIHLATGEFADLLQEPSMLLSELQADADAVARIDARYKAELAPLISIGHYEKAAGVRDRKNEAKKHLNHISHIEVVVDYGTFYPIQIYAHGKKVMVEMYHNHYYAVTSLIKTLVDLGGQYGYADKVLALPKSWLKLKQWQDYRWYNRPRK